MDAEGASRGAELHNKPVGSIREWFEVVMAVERGSFGINRVDNDQFAAGDTGGFDDRAERPHQKLGAEPLAVEVLAQGKFGKQDRRDLAGCSSSDLLRRVGAVEDMRCDSEVRNDGVGDIQDDIGTSALAGGEACVVAQPTIQFGISAPEPSQLVRVAEGGDPQGHRRAIRGFRATRLAALARVGARSALSRAATKRSK